MNLIKQIKKSRLQAGELFIIDLFDKLEINNNHFTINNNVIMIYDGWKLTFSETIFDYLKLIEKNIELNIISQLIKKYSRINFNINVEIVEFTYMKITLSDVNIYDNSCEKMVNDLFAKIEYIVGDDIKYFNVNHNMLINIDGNKISILVYLYNYFNLITNISRDELNNLIFKQLEKFNIDLKYNYITLVW